MAEPKIENAKKIPNPKYSSIVGTGFPDYVQTQLNLRSQTGNKKKRDNYSEMSDLFIKKNKT